MTTRISGCHRLAVAYLTGLIVVTPYIAGTADTRTAGLCEAHTDVFLMVLKLAADAASNACVLLSSGRVFYKAVYQEMLTPLRPLTPSPPLNTALILPDGDEENMRGMFKRFDEVANAGGILRVRVLFPGVSVVTPDATSDK